MMMTKTKDPRPRNRRRTLELPEVGPYITGTHYHPRPMCPVHGLVNKPTHVDPENPHNTTPRPSTEYSNRDHMGDLEYCGPYIRSRSAEGPKEGLIDGQKRIKKPQPFHSSRNPSCDWRGTSHNHVSLTPDLTEYVKRLKAVTTHPKSTGRKDCSGPVDSFLVRKTSPRTLSAVNTGNGDSKYTRPRAWFAVSCFMATLSFMFSVNTDLLPDVSNVALKNLLPPQHINGQDDSLSVVVIIIMWGVHFLRRFTEILFVHKYRRQCHLLEGFGINIYYTVFGFWIGWSCNYFTKYMTPKNYVFYPFILIFIVGEVGNCWCHIKLRSLSKTQVSTLPPSSDIQVLPSGVMFAYIYHPHYVFEAVTWLGYAGAVFTLPALLFLVINIVLLLVYAGHRRARYLRQCDGLDGRPLFNRHKGMVIPKFL